MRRFDLAPLAVGVLLLASGCTDATGSVQGGEALTTQAATNCEPTWTSLYASYFGPTGQASCSPTTQSSCHSVATELGAQTSGFVCGSTKDGCWQGMTVGIPPAEGGFFPAILAPDAGDPTQSQLWLGIHKASGGGLNNMPCGNPTICTASVSAYTFTASDLACISTWAQQGAPNN